MYTGVDDDVDLLSVLEALESFGDGGESACPGLFLQECAGLLNV